MKRLIAFLSAVTFSILPACSSDNMPAKSELQTALSQNFPAHVRLSNFTVQASQNFGNKVEPIHGSRFQATVIIMVDLYNKDKKEKGVTFVRLVTEKGSQTDIFGKITSQLYQGSWKHNIDIDGNPIRNLGIPLNQVRADRVIIRGSDKEKIYYDDIERKESKHRAEIERTEAELRSNIANAKIILVGTWKGKDYLVTFKSDGTYSVKYDTGWEGIGSWSVDGNIIIYENKRSKSENGKWRVDNRPDRSKILYIDKNRVTEKAISGHSGTTTHVRVK